MKTTLHAHAMKLVHESQNEKTSVIQHYDDAVAIIHPTYALLYKENGGGEFTTDVRGKKTTIEPLKRTQLNKLLAHDVDLDNEPDMANMRIHVKTLYDIVNRHVTIQAMAKRQYTDCGCEYSTVFTIENNECHINWTYADGHIKGREVIPCATKGNTSFMLHNAVLKDILYALKTDNVQVITLYHKKDSYPIYIRSENVEAVIYAMKQ